MGYFDLCVCVCVCVCVCACMQVVYFVFHQMKGIPFESGDQGVTRRLTHWEQLDGGSSSRQGKSLS